MKKVKVLLLAIFAMATTGAFAQSSPWWLEGQLGVDYEKPDGVDATTQFNIGIGANYKLSNEWSIGANLIFNRWDNGLNDGSMFYVNPQAIYAKQMSERWFWTPTCKIILGFGDETVIGLGVDLLAFEYKVSNRWALGMACNFGDVRFISNDAGSRFNFQLGRNESALGNIGLRFGFHYYL